MENNVVNTEPIQRTHQKIGKHLRATHYKLGLDGKKIIFKIIIFHYYIINYRLGLKVNINMNIYTKKESIKKKVSLQVKIQVFF